MWILEDRLKHIGRIARWWWAVTYGAWTLLCSFDVLVEHYGSESLKASYNNGWIAPKWGLHAWVIGLLVITVFAILEGSYKYSTTLEERLRPKLTIPKRIHKQPWTDVRGKCVSYYIDVVNESQGTTIDGIEVCLTDIDPPEIEWLPVPLHIKHDNSEPHKKEFSLNPLGKKQIDVLSSVQGAGDIRIESTIGGTGVTVPAGRYTMTIMATGRDVKPTEAMFDVWVDHTGYLRAKAIK
jgi:hypothetical protein